MTNTSVVLASFNGERYIKKQLDSIRLQSLQPNEVLIQDDCSSDTTFEFIKKYIEDHDLNNWKVTENQVNLGYRKNFWNLLESTSGDVIFLSDQDDIWLSEKIKAMTHVMQENPYIDLLTCEYTKFFDETDINADEKINDDYLDKDIIEKVPLPKNILIVPYPGCAYAIRKSFFMRIQPFWDGTYVHDAILWRSAVLLESAYIYKKPLMLWRYHSDSTSHKDFKNIKQLHWRNFEREELLILQNFIDIDESVTEKDRKKNILERNLNWVDLRKQFYTSKNPFAGLRLLKYLDLYRNIKQYIKEWIITFL